MSKSSTLITITPADVRGWRHGDAQFLMLLSGVCGWSARLGTGKGAQLVSKSGETMLVPDNTGLKIGVFRSWASKIMTHAERKPTAKAVFELMEEAKLDPSHRRVAWEAIGMEPYVQPTVGAVAPPTDRYKVVNQGKVVYTADDPAAAVALAKEAVTKETGPFRVVEIANGKLFAEVHWTADIEHRVKRISPWVLANGDLSHACMEREWSDGTIDYVCSHEGCGFSAEKPLRVTSHFRAHTKDRSKWKSQQGKAPVAQPAEAPPQERNSAGSTPAGGTFNPMAVSANGSHTDPVEEFFDALVESAEQKLERIRAIVSADMATAVEKLTKERDAALRRAEDAERRLAALRDALMS